MVDLQLAVIPNTLLCIGIAVAAMIVVSICFFEDTQCVVLISLAIVSIDFGVIGFCSLAKISLDSISMITFTMSVGFSVDYWLVIFSVYEHFVIKTYY